MEVLRNGKFSFVFSTAALEKGISAELNASRNKPTCFVTMGLLGQDGSLAVMQTPTQTATPIGLNFPYPQLFVFSQHVILCTPTKIYERDGSAWIEKLTVDEGSTWAAVDFGDFIVLSNERVVVIRDPGSQQYAVKTGYDAFSCACNYNGQVLIGSPEA